VSEYDSSEVADLQRTIESLQGECRQKERFIATLAHELRNPITALRAAVHLQELSGDKPAVRKKTFDIIARQTTQIERLIDDLMDVSRLSRGTVSLDICIVDLTSVAAQVFVDHQKSFEDLGIELIIELDDDPIWVEADVTRLNQVMGNLLDNARKASSSGERVSVSVRQDKARGDAELRVSDMGVGLGAQEAKRIFDQFTQISTGERGDNGLGLGLAIVMGIVELHDGQIEVHSDGQGEGCSFIVRLPLSPPPPPKQTDRDAPSTLLDERYVLIIEDDRDVAQLLVQLLELEGHRIELAYDAEEGLERLKHNTPDTILCDIELPGDLDGHALCRAIKVDPRFDSVRLVAMTGHSGEGTREMSFGSGFDDHLTKPVGLKELRRVLEASSA
jgi:CheY-like chemotaxis protein/nitrogen-specific signal transduction histidine kinase